MEWPAPPAARLSLAPSRFPVDSRFTLAPAQRPAQPAKHSHLFLLFGAQDVGHPRVATSWPTRRQRLRPTSRLAGFQVFPTGRFWAFPEAAQHPVADPLHQLLHVGIQHFPLRVELRPTAARFPAVLDHNPGHRPGSDRRLSATAAHLMYIEHTALIVRDYDEAIRFFVDGLGFELTEDVPALTNDGRSKRWVVVKPPGARSGLLLARADGPHQQRATGEQFAGRVGLFLRVDDFEAAFARMRRFGVEFVTAPRTESYGRVAVFLDVAGNRWDLLGPNPN